ncbi:hypothetical protein GQR58_021697 [Nymphon striatum]|nr:hypothetical protein GQR58_021697 [Nymphon striatum]
MSAIQIDTYIQCIARHKNSFICCHMRDKHGTSKHRNVIEIIHHVTGVKCTSQLYHPLLGKIPGFGLEKNLYRNDYVIELSITYEMGKYICICLKPSLNLNLPSSYKVLKSLKKS